MNTKKEKNNITNLIIVIIILCCAGGAIAWGLSLMKRTNENRVKVDQLRAELAITKQKVEQLPELREKHRNYEEIIQKLKKFIPNDEEQANFVLTLESIAKRSDIIIKNCKLNESPQSYKKFPNYRIYQWEVNIDGKYLNVKRFMEALQNSNRLVMVNSLKLNSSSGDQENGEVYSLNTNLKLDLITKLDSGR